MNMKLAGIVSLTLLYAGLSNADSGVAAVLPYLHLPDGFKITLYADHVPNARTLALGDEGVVYVGTRQSGGIYALQDSDHDGKVDKQYTLAKDLVMPNGVAYKDGSLYVAEVNRILRFPDITKHLDNPGKPVVVYDKLPNKTHHGWKFLRFGPDNKLYTAVGAPCNVCAPEEEIFGSLVRLNPDGSEFEILARGIRNSVGFDWLPSSKQLFFTDNGRDNLGDDVPPEELNQWRQKGQHFGFPYCHAGDIPDPEFGKQKDCQQFVPPVWKFKAHVAPLGVRFYSGSQFPAEYQQQLFVAQHGSWNRTEPQGYRVVTLQFKDGKPIAEKVFIDGWLLPNGDVLGRPTDILQMPDGSLLIADDTLGVIYKVTYRQ